MVVYVLICGLCLPLADFPFVTVKSIKKKKGNKMARNAEKAMTTLARWRAAQVQEAGGQRERRPYLASECNDLPQAEKWRLQIVREIAKKVAQIQNGGGGKSYDEIYTQMNNNELKIRVPKSTKLERTGKYKKLQEMCIYEETPYNTGEQIQFEMPRDFHHQTYTNNLKYTHKGCDRSCESNDKRKVINVTPSNCPVPSVNMVKKLDPFRDVFILKVGKKLECKDRRTELEIELCTPKAPNVVREDVGAQVSSTSIKPKGKKEKKRTENAGKKGGKAKKKKAGLGEFRIRDLNDEINKLMREKRHWEVQIKSLGGPDHARVGPKMLDQDGKEVPGNRGYKYFGAAKDLPGVRELFEQEPPPPPRRTRADLMRDVDADYYGYRDDDDGLLTPLELAAEKESIARAVAEWKKNKEQNKDQELPEEENIYPEDPDDKRIEDDDEIAITVTSHVAVPSQKDVEEALLRRKKQELLEQYGCMDVKLES